VSCSGLVCPGLVLTDERRVGWDSAGCSPCSRTANSGVGAASCCTAMFTRASLLSISQFSLSPLVASSAKFSSQRRTRRHCLTLSSPTSGAQSFEWYMASTLVATTASTSASPIKSSRISVRLAHRVAFSSTSCRFVRALFRRVHVWTSLLRMSNSVKYVPAWFPGADFQRYAAKAQVHHRRMRDKPIDVVTAEMVHYGAVPILYRHICSCSPLHTGQRHSSALYVSSDARGGRCTPAGAVAV
jgi:hypothetical protein